MTNNTGVPIAFVDTEATGLLPDDEVWEFAGRRRNPDGTIQDLHMFLKHDEEKARQLPASFYKDWEIRYNRDTAYELGDAARKIHEFTAGCHIVGAVPSFDTTHLAKILRQHRLEPRWHYHLTDIENVVLGYLAGRGQLIDPPWKSDALSRAIHVEPDDFDRHTAFGDVLWAEAQWTAIMEPPGDGL